MIKRKLIWVKWSVYDTIDQMQLECVGPLLYEDRETITMALIFSSSNYSWERNNIRIPKANILERRNVEINNVRF